MNCNVNTIADATTAHNPAYLALLDFVCASATEARETMTNDRVAAAESMWPINAETSLGTVVELTIVVWAHGSVGVRNDRGDLVAAACGIDAVHKVASQLWNRGYRKI